MKNTFCSSKVPHECHFNAASLTKSEYQHAKHLVTAVTNTATIFSRVPMWGVHIRITPDGCFCFSTEAAFYHHVLCLVCGTSPPTPSFTLNISSSGPKYPGLREFLLRNVHTTCKVPIPPVLSLFSLQCIFHMHSFAYIWVTGRNDIITDMLHFATSSRVFLFLDTGLLSHGPSVLTVMHLPHFSFY